MNLIEENLFYSEDENMLFYIAGNPPEGKTEEEKDDYLRQGQRKLAETAEVETKDVGTIYIKSSTRLANAQIFYTNKSARVPEYAYRIKECPMARWLSE
jgi:hypothetical protein